MYQFHYLKCSIVWRDFLQCILLHRFPFDWRNPIGYIFAILLEIPCSYYAPLVLIFDLFFAFGICKLLGAMADDIGTELQYLNKPHELMKNIHKFIELQSTIKRLSESKFSILAWWIRLLIWHFYFRLVSDLSDTFQFNYIMYFLWAIISIADLLLMIHTVVRIQKYLL